MRRDGIWAQTVRISLLILLLSFSAACEPPRISELSAEEGITRIKETHQDERWDLVIAEVDEYRSRYPYSKFAAEAELLQADSFYQSGRYPEAIATYDAFLAKYPKHPEAAFALYRSALCIDQQSPEASDREQQFAQRALETYSEFIEDFPDHEKVALAKERVSVLRKRIAGQTLFIARFYWKKDLYPSALTRYLEILERFPMYPEMRKEALERIAKAYAEIAKGLESEPGSDKWEIYRDETPESLRQKSADYARRAESFKADEVEAPANDSE